jgi:hypothetical protein
MSDPSADKVLSDQALVSQLYQGAQQHTPAPSTDRAILAMAKKKIKLSPDSLANQPRVKKTSVWWQKMQYQGAVAASIVLVCFVALLQPQSPHISLLDPLPVNSPVATAMQNDALVSEVLAVRSSTAPQQAAPMMARREVTNSRFQAQSAELADVTMADAAIVNKSMGELSNKPNNHPKLRAKNHLIIQELLMIQAKLYLTHGQITLTAQSPDVKYSKVQNSLIKHYLALHKNMKIHLRIILNGTSDPTILEGYSGVLSRQEINGLKKNRPTP